LARRLLELETPEPMLIFPELLLSIEGK